MVRTTTWTFGLIVMLASTSLAFGQTAINYNLQSNTLNVNFFKNANTTGLPDAEVDLTNPGTAGANVCALIYVFFPDQEMTECCGCTLTPDGLRTLSVNADLTANPLTGVKVTAGVIKVVSSSFGGTCDPRSITPTKEIKGWLTHVLTLSTGGFQVTESPFETADFGTVERSSLQAGCKSIVSQGSGHGICTCGIGD